MDRFSELLAFVRTVEGGSQSAAARALGLTPAMVGRTLQALEDRLGTRLLNRTTQKQSLTEAGAAFHPRAVALLEQLEEAERTASDRQETPRGVLRINAPMSFGARHLAAAAADFCALHPAVRMELTLNDRVVDLVEEGHDLAIRIGRLADSSLVARRLAPCRVAVAAAPAYLAAHGEPSHPEELRQHNCLLYSYASQGDSYTFVSGQEQEVAVRLAGDFVANNGDALAAAALAGRGVILQPTFILGDALRGGALVLLLPEWRLRDLDIHAMYPSPRHLSPKVRGFVDYLVARYRVPPWDAGLA